MVRPADHVHDSPEAVAVRERMQALLEAVVGADSDLLSVPASDLVRRLRLLTFAGSHPHISDGAVLTPEEIVFTLLHGLLRPEERKQA